MNSNIIQRIPEPFKIKILSKVKLSKPQDIKGQTEKKRLEYMYIKLIPEKKALLENFKKSLQILGKLAELRISIMRLAQEVKKTIRKVNALEKIAIPNLEETVHYIQMRLEENERDMFVLMKMVKSRLEKRKEHDG